MGMRTLAMLLAVVACGTTQAQTVYRCGSSYSEQPCAGARALDTTSAAPSPQEAARAAVNARRDRQLADAMEKDRLRQERKAAPALIMAQPEPPPVHATAQPAQNEAGRKPKKRKNEKAGAPAGFKAVAPPKAAATPLRK